MKMTLRLLVPVLLLAGLFGPMMMPESSLRLYFVVLLILTLAVAAMLGLYWSTQIARGAPIQIDRIDDQLSRLLEGHLKLLQGTRPKVFVIDARSAASASPFRVIGEKFSGLFMCSLLLLGVFGIVAAEFFDPKGGVFGSLLDTPFGQGIAVVIGQYITVSAGGFVFAGFRLRFI